MTTYGSVQSPDSVFLFPESKECYSLCPDYPQRGLQYLYPKLCGIERTINESLPC